MMATKAEIAAGIVYMWDLVGHWIVSADDITQLCREMGVTLDTIEHVFTDAQGNTATYLFASQELKNSITEIYLAATAEKEVE